MLIQKSSQYDSLDIKHLANGLWANIFSSHGIEVPSSPNKHSPCPSCGGVDRFRFDDKGGNGSYICSQCGAGDGFSLLMKCFHWSFPQALGAVASYLGTNITPTIPAPAVPTSYKQLTEPTPNIKKQQRINNTLTKSERTGLPLDRYFINLETADEK